MAAIALNTYKTVRSEVTTGITTIYTAPNGVSSIILYAQVANTSSGIVTVTAYHGRAGNPFEIVKNARIPATDVLNVVNGSFVLETGDTFEFQGSSNGTMKAIISILETAK